MSSLQDIPNFLFISMTGPKVAQRIQIVSLFCFMKQSLWWDYFAFIRTQLVEVILCQVQYAERIDWGLRQWCSRDRNHRERDLAETSRPRLCHKSRDRNLKARDRDRDVKPHISLMIIKANSLQNAAKNIWNVAKHQDEGVCRCYASINLFWLRKICKLSCSLKNTTNHIVRTGRDALMKLPCSGLLLSIEVLLFENVAKRRIISFYFKQLDVGECI